ncbi:hypothetical protein B0A78_06775 [Flavobacterium columnare NBRC 100251 = ATCC 23463]|uniref:HTH cro/C1-type domain-containing protein n=2 Tax=Flavobacterium columnare TaxID=996 RepID=G8X987_FLACA|nr:hypothetical protein [Flavobacterium columnare]AEW85138.1 hypothetical protein FCOL_01445 [Flavobacterium columnare ATCC 49512]AMO19517.1 hypothetical protein UN65_03410 [Flavobacterium columnare]ANO49086.1 hypothetical protein Pf1_00838 [Flavobacterium columnare]APT22914.1 hypothetical protein BU993_09985 [Flavobacterium columnare]AUX17460.1 hypothetical protein AQ623_03510 [Flavobacterium columnare]
MDANSIILEIKKRGLTGYKIAEKTKLTEVGINKILNGTSKKPRKSTLRILHNYLVNQNDLNQFSKVNLNTDELFEIDSLKIELKTAYDTITFLKEQNDFLREQVSFYKEKYSSTQYDHLVKTIDDKVDYLYETFKEKELINQLNKMREKTEKPLL